MRERERERCIHTHTPHTHTQNILLPSLVWWCYRISQSVTWNKNCLLSSRSQRGLLLSKYYSDCYIFWTADSLATKFGLMKGYHRPVRLVEKLDSQQKVKLSMFTQMISSKSPNILLPNLVLQCIILSWGVRHTDWFAIFKVKVTARAHMIKIWLFLLHFLNCWFLGNQTWSDDTSS